MGQDIKEIQEDALRTSERAIVAAQKGMLCRKSRVGLLSQLDIPILFIFGKKDQRIPLEIGLSQAMLPKYSETIILGNSGHMGHFEERKYLKLKIYNFAQSCYYLP
jgi:pimeloyl-ACP methyl ester carboxylesterase